MTGSTQIPAENLPSGTLTFLFTDVEGSTRLWELCPEKMQAAMARHDELIDSAISQTGGVIVRPRGEGDSRFAVFYRATEAAAAAILIQRKFSAETWDLIYPLRVRMALHTGEADLRNGDYYGLAVNRCSRLRSVAHGGQILVSQITHFLISEALPGGVGLRDLGEQRLKDLKDPERIYQLIIEGLPADFPPLQTQNNSLTNLPVALTSFIGRENEMAEVMDILSTRRLLTISGAGGAGKTRLAIQAAADLLNSFADGVWYIDMAPLTNTALVPQYLMNNLGIREDGCCTPMGALLESVRERSTLLILDNCEHLLKGIADMVEALLQGTLHLKILITSREPLGISGETVWNIPSLSTPNIEKVPSIEQLMQIEAVKLFIERAISIRTDFILTDRNASAVAQICTRLDGIPLAIELAAARVRVLSVDEIAVRLDDRFRLLVGNRNSVPRQKTLRNLIDWSHDLLPESERALLRRLSVFAGGWTLQAAEEICSDGKFSSIEVLDLLAHLVDKSLVIAETQDGSKRYRFLETIRQYAKERLAESGEGQDFTRRHAEYFNRLAEESYAEQWGPRQGYWLARLEVEHDNLRAAMEWMAGSDDSGDMLLRTSGSLWRFWEIHGHIGEGRSRLEHALTHTPNASKYLRANGLRGAGMLALQHGDYVQATAMHQESLSLFHELGDKLGIGRELDVLGELAQYKGDYSKAIEYHNQSLNIRYEIGDQEGIAVSLGQLGVIDRDRGEYGQAKDLLEKSLSLFRKLGDKRLIAQSLNNLGLVEHPLCEYRRAALLFKEAVSIYQELHDKLGISNSLLNLGNMAKDQGDFKVAKAVYNECLALKQEIGDKRGIARTLVGMAEAAFYQGNYPLSAEMAEKSSIIFDELGVKRGYNNSLQIKAFIAVFQGELMTAQSIASQCIALSTEINSPRAIAYTKMILGLCAYAESNLGKAHTQLLGARDIFEKFGDRRSVAVTLVNLARTAYREDNHARALQYLKESLSISRELEIQWVLGFTLEIMGLIQRSQGHYERSLELFQESLTVALEQDNRQGIANCLGAIAGLSVLTNQPFRATRLFSAAEKIRREIGVKMGIDDLDEYEHYLSILQDQLDENAFEIAWADGEAMTSEQMIEDLTDRQATPIAV